MGDGTFVFGSPVAALWAAQQAHAPFLTVIFDNAGYNASKRRSSACSRRAPRPNWTPSPACASPPDYAALARSCHAHGERVEDPTELVPALSAVWRWFEAAKRQCWT